MTAFTSKPRLSLHKESELLPKTQNKLTSNNGSS